MFSPKLLPLLPASSPFLWLFSLRTKGLQKYTELISCSPLCCYSCYNNQQGVVVTPGVAVRSRSARMQTKPDHVRARECEWGRGSFSSYCSCTEMRSGEVFLIILMLELWKMIWRYLQILVIMSNSFISCFRLVPRLLLEQMDFAMFIVIRLSQTF